MIEPVTGVEGFFAFLRERYRILLKRRAGQPAPWTTDPVLQQWRFCNVRREDDKVTEWFRENIRDPLKDDPRVFFATVAFRWFNTIATGEFLKPFLLEGRWDRYAIATWMDGVRAGGGPIFTNAFIVNSAAGKLKHLDVLDNLAWVRSHWRTEDLRLPWTKRELFNAVKLTPRLGNFAAYQVVVDLQYTYLLRDATDLQTFTVAGPGCAKGIGWCAHEDPEHFSYGSRFDQDTMLAFMVECLAESRKPELWPEQWPAFMLSDIESGFCEFAKYRAGLAGFRLKRKFTPCS